MVLTPIIILLVETTAMAAEFIPNHEPDPDAPSGALSNLLIRGSIVEGDAERLAQLLVSYRVRRMPVIFLLDSPGGVLKEAMRMALIIDSVFGTTRVDNSIQMDVNPVERGFLCASACFYLYVAGAVRWPAIVPSSGQIGVHRPYFGQNPSLDLKKEIQSHDAIVASARIFLEHHRVPTRLIELSFSRSSTEIYWLNRNDLIDVGFMNFAIEEMAIRECKYLPQLSRQVFENSGTRQYSVIGESITCLNNLLAPSIKEAYARLTRGQRPWQ